MRYHLYSSSTSFLLKSDAASCSSSHISSSCRTRYNMWDSEYPPSSSRSSCSTSTRGNPVNVSAHFDLSLTNTTPLSSTVTPEATSWGFLTASSPSTASLTTGESFVIGGSFFNSRFTASCMALSISKSWMCSCLLAISSSTCSSQSSTIPGSSIETASSSTCSKCAVINEPIVSAFSTL